MQSHSVTILEGAQGADEISKPLKEPSLHSSQVLPWCLRTPLARDVGQGEAPREKMAQTRGKIQK